MSYNNQYIMGQNHSVKVSKWMGESMRDPGKRRWQTQFVVVESTDHLLIVAFE